MDVLSLFDGISCARVSLDRASIPVRSYRRSEVDPHANQIAITRYPESIHLGDVRSVHPDGWKVDLLIGGSPCQDLSIAKKDRKGLDGNRSGLFWEYVRIWKEAKPTWFILENVASMPKKDRDIITETLGVEPVLINAALVSAQSRKRLFWTNIPIQGLPEDRGILLKDILLPETEVDEKLIIKSSKTFCLTEPSSKKNALIKVGKLGERDNQASRVYSTEGKSQTLTAPKTGGVSGAHTGLYAVSEPMRIRKLDPVECERLQGLPDGYTEGISTTQRYKCLGNAFNVDVIAWILQHLKKPSQE